MEASFRWMYQFKSCIEMACHRVLAEGWCWSQGHQTPPQSIQGRFLADEEPLTDAVSMVGANLQFRRGGGPVMVKNRFV